MNKEEILKQFELFSVGGPTYMVDEEKKTVTYRIVSSSFPNWEGKAQTRTIDKLTADEFVNTNPSVAGGRGSASNFYRRGEEGAGPRPPGENLGFPPLFFFFQMGKARARPTPSTS